MGVRTARSLRLGKGRLDHRAAWMERGVRVSGSVQVPPQGAQRVSDQLQRQQHTPYPIAYHMRVSPLYRNSDGMWPRVPEGHEAGDHYAATRDGKSVQWKRLYRPLELRNEDEVLVFLVAHEAFHYLRKTRQVEGRHGEIEADAFALEALEQYCEEPK